MKDNPHNNQAPISKKSNPFTQHPHEVGMSYTGHALFALSLARKTILMSGASLVHAVFPFLFTTYTSRKTALLYETLKNRTTNLKSNEPNN